MGTSVKPAALTDEEWAIQRLIDESEHACAYCEEDIHSVEELRLVQVVYSNKTPTGLEFYAIENDEGEYQYQPWFFHFTCWEDVQERLVEIIEDQEPVFDPLEQKAVECDGCTADIRPWETTGLISFGEIHRSQLMPNGENTFHFDTCNSKPHVLCISCLWHINNEVLEMWEELSHNGECAEGIASRCWRDGGCRSGCRKLLAAE
jgi:hypothetical protein